MLEELYKGTIIPDDMYSEGIMAGVDYAIKKIEAAPAVDAVEVVLCKDCKHSRERDEHEREYVVEGVVICTNRECSEDNWFATWDDHWCKCGERRADE